MYVYLDYDKIKNKNKISQDEASDFVQKNYKGNPDMKEYVIVVLEEGFGAVAMPYEKEGFERLIDNRSMSFYIIKKDDAISSIVKSEKDTFLKILKNHNQENDNSFSLF